MFQNKHELKLGTSFVCRQFIYSMYTVRRSNRAVQTFLLSSIILSQYGSCKKNSDSENI